MDRMPSQMRISPLHGLVFLFGVLTAADSMAERVSVPLNMEPAFIESLLREAVFTGTGTSVRINDDGSGCQFLELREPRISTGSARVRLRTFVSARAGRAVGDRCVLHPNVTVGYDCVLGDDVIVQSNAVIGAEGYGFAQDETGRSHRIPQLGRVVLEDRVSVGAGTCIDRATLGETRIGAGSRLDNLVQVGHNNRLGRNVLLVSQVGIAGSTSVGASVTLAGQVGIVGHITIGDRVKIQNNVSVYDGVVIEDHHLTASYFTTLAKLGMAVHADAPFGRDDFGHAAGIAQPGNFQQFHQLDIVPLDLECRLHRPAIFLLSYLNSDLF